MAGLLDSQRKTLLEEIEDLIRSNDTAALLLHYYNLRSQPVFEDHSQRISEFLFSKRQMIFSMASASEELCSDGAIVFLVDHLEAIGWEPIYSLLKASTDDKKSRLILETLKERVPITDGMERLKLPVNKVDENKLVELFKRVPTNASKAQILAEIIATVCDPDTITNLLVDQKAKPCRIHGGLSCHVKIQKGGTFFIAYDSRNKEFKDTAKGVFEKKYSYLKGVDYEERFTDKTIFCKICEMIQEAVFCVLDLSADEKNDRPNPNVMLELGVAICVGTPVVMCVKRGTREISDLGGVERIGYENYEELRNKLERANFKSLIPFTPYG